MILQVFSDGDTYSNLWSLTWDRINSFLPKLKDELFKPIGNFVLFILLLHTIVYDSTYEIYFLENSKMPVSLANPEQNSQEHSNIPSTYNQTNPGKNINLPVHPPKPPVNPTVNQTGVIDQQKSAINNNAMPVQNPIFVSNLNQGNALNQLPGPQNPLVANTTMKSSSIILQPPVIGSQVHSPLFSHLGQVIIFIS